MFFLLSKILEFAISPLVWVFLLLLYSVFSKNTARKRKSLIASVSILYFFSNAFILDEFMRKWEVQATPYEKVKNYDVGIVLGGMSNFDVGFQRIQFIRSGDRLFQAIELYKTGYIKKLIIVGGSGSMVRVDEKEAEGIKIYLERIGIPQEDVVYETNSRNTYENAVETKKILAEKFPNQKYLLITSGYHMKRALACFEKQNIKTTPYSTDRYSGPRKFIFDHTFIPDKDILGIWHVLIHEWVGYITYWFAGYA